MPIIAFIMADLSAPVCVSHRQMQRTGRKVNPFSCFPLCRLHKLPHLPLFIPFSLQIDHFFHIPGHGGPHNVARIPLRPAAAVHPVVRFEMPDDGLGPISYALVAARMTPRPFARCGQSLYPPAPSVPLHAILRLMKSPVPGDLLDGPSRVEHGSSETLNRCLRMCSPTMSRMNLGRLPLLLLSACNAQAG